MNFYALYVMKSLNPLKIERRLSTAMEWKKANDPPETTPGNWSREVVVLTNYGDVFQLTYSGTKENGCWQRPARFNKGEKVEWWIDKP